MFCTWGSAMETGTFLPLFAVLIVIKNTQGGQLNCNVSQMAEQTLYSVPKVDASQDVLWSNFSDHTVAIQDGSFRNQMKQVVTFNKTHLLLLECKEVILYKTTDLKGVAHTANCTTPCGQKRRVPAGGGSFWIHLGLGIFAAVLLVVAVVAFIVCCKTRNRPEQTVDEFDNPKAAVAEKLLPL